MSRWMPVLLAGLVALPLLARSPEAGAAVVTIGGCYYPSVAVSVFEARFFQDIDLVDDPGRMKDQCKDFLDGCKKAIKHDSNCVEAGFAAIQNAADEGCKDIADPDDRAACSDGLKADAEEFRSNLDDNKTNSEQTCHDCYEMCLAGDECLTPE